MRVKIITKKHGAVYANVDKEKYVSISSVKEISSTEIFVAWYRTKSKSFAGSGETQKEAISGLIWAIDNDHHVIQV